MVSQSHTSEVFTLEEDEDVEFEFSSGVVVSGVVTSTTNEQVDTGYRDSLLVDIGDEVLSISRMSEAGEYFHHPVREKGYVVGITRL